MSPVPRSLAGARVGLGWRPELALELLAQPASVDFVEVVAESCFAQPAARREARALAEIWPVVPHGVKLSLGSAPGVEIDRARRLGALAKELRAPLLSEHVAFTRAGRVEIGHLTALPYTREAVRVVAANVARVRRVLPDVPLLLENVAWSLRWPEDEMAEGDFYCEVAAATGCRLLLDLANLYANAVNSGVAPHALLQSYPLDAVGMVHLAGGVWQDGFYFDTHAHAVADAVLELLRDLAGRTGPLPVLIERDGAFPPFEELLGETRRARALLEAAAAVPGTAALTPAPRDARQAAGTASGLAARQALLAGLLTQRTAPALDEADRFEHAALVRTRAILQHKRVDDALPLLSRCAGAEAARDVALRAVRDTPRSPRAAGIADARRIAEAAARDPRLWSLARLDRLELRSRFGRRDRARLLPFLGCERLADGRRVWAWKGLGREAPVRFYETGNGGVR